MTRVPPAGTESSAPSSLSSASSVLPLLPRLRALLAARLGLQFDDRQDDRLIAALTRLSGTSGPARYMDQLELAPTRARLDALAGELTVGETFFFRHPEQFDALRFDLLSTVARAGFGTGRRLRALSAGCASGEEAYTLAITLHRAGLAAQGIDWDVLAVDLNPAALARASLARYGEWSLRATAPEQREQWFQSTAPGEWTPLPAIRERVRFESRHLGLPDPGFWSPDRFDIIFCRNVLIYLEPAALRQAIRNMIGALAPGGVLFLGHVETLRGQADAQAAGLTLRQAHGCFFYQRALTPPSPPAWPFPWEATPGLAPALGAPRASEPTSVFAPAIPAAAFADERLGRIGVTDGPDRPDRPDRESPAAAARTASPWDQALLDDALRLVESGQVEDGLRACAKLIAPQTPAPLQAEVLFLQGLAMEERGQLPAAEWHHQRAAAKDAGFALPHLRLGLLARRRGEIVAARRELRRALELLDSESDERLRRFGGGFEREDLRRLCRDEIQEARA
ncbi:CheR family methyltransferase [Roseateles sp. So40a]|uniref:CheR family methyltransferase n=1 Tax=Roseateles sp. So40a TaxID=3400226 RepID=UPI003A83EB1F